MKYFKIYSLLFFLLHPFSLYEYFKIRRKFNILEHSLVPPHRALSHDEALTIKNKYNVSDQQLPNISYFSPVSLVMGFRPGDIIEINRKSRTSIRYFYYRICKI